MRTFKAVMVMIFFGTFVLAASSPAADVAKIGMVDFQKILETSSAGKKAQAEISEQGQKMENDLKLKGEDIEEIKKKLERESMVMSKEMREEKEREIRIKINDFKTLQKKYLNDFKMEEQRLVTQIRNDVFELIEDIGKKEGYLLILEKREGGVMYIPGTNDITDKLIRAYNTKYAQQKEAKTEKK